MLKFLASLMFMVLVSATAFGQQPILLTPKNTVMLRGEVGTQFVYNAQTVLMDLVNKRGSQSYPIYLVLDSPGGSIDGGEDLIQFAKTIRNVKTITIFAASMGSAIVQAIPGERLIVDTGILMFHRATIRMGGQIEDGEMESNLDFIKRFVRSMELRNAKRMSMSLEHYKSLVKDEYWTFGQEAVNRKAADRVVNVQCSADLIPIQDLVKMSVRTPFGTIEVDLNYSRCPLFRIGVPKAEKDLKALNEARQMARKYGQELKLRYLQ